MEQMTEHDTVDQLMAFTLNDLVECYRVLGENDFFDYIRVYKPELFNSIEEYFINRMDTSSYDEAEYLSELNRGYMQDRI